MLCMKPTSMPERKERALSCSTANPEQLGKRNVAGAVNTGELKDKIIIVPSSAEKEISCFSTCPLKRVSSTLRVHCI